MLFSARGGGRSGGNSALTRMATFRSRWFNIRGGQEGGQGHQMHRLRIIRIRRHCLHSCIFRSPHCTLATFIGPPTPCALRPAPLALSSQLALLQSRLLDVGSAVATPLDQSNERKKAQVQFDRDATARLEVGGGGGGRREVWVGAAGICSGEEVWEEWEGRGS